MVVTIGRKCPKVLHCVTNCEVAVPLCPQAVVCRIKADALIPAIRLLSTKGTPSSSRFQNHFLDSFDEKLVGPLVIVVAILT